MNREQLKEVKRLTNSPDYIKGYDNGASHFKESLLKKIEGKKEEVISLRELAKRGYNRALEDIKKLIKEDEEGWTGLQDVDVD